MKYKNKTINDKLLILIKFKTYLVDFKKKIYIN